MVSLLSIGKGYAGFFFSWAGTLIAYWIVIGSGILDLFFSDDNGEIIKLFMIIAFAIAQIAIPLFAMFYDDNESNTLQAIIAFFASILIIYLLSNMGTLSGLADMMPDEILKITTWTSIILTLLSGTVIAPILIIIQSSNRGGFISIKNK